MNFFNHSDLSGMHAAFSPSQPYWLRYDDEKLIEVYNNRKAMEHGTRLHAWAKETIDLGIKQPRSKKTLSQYVNDAIGFGMSTEVVLFYSRNFYGTADAISFRDNVLRIHDLKTGGIPGKIEQLEIYAALFCLEYKYKPQDIVIELRIYQSDEIKEHFPNPKDIQDIMDHICHCDEVIEHMEHRRM